MGDIPKNIEIHYYESFAQTHQGHGTDVAIVGGAMGYSTFDNRIKSSLEIAADDGIKIDIIEEEGDSIGQHQTVLISNHLVMMVATLKLSVFQSVVVQLKLKVFI